MSEQDPDLVRRRLLKGAAAMICLSVSPVGLAALTHIVAVRVWPSSTYTRVTLESSAPLQYKHFFLTNPDRLVVDIKGVSLNKTFQDISSLVQEKDPLLKLARVGQFDKETVRLVLELKHKIDPEIFTLKPIAEFKNRLVIDLYPAKSASSLDDDPLLALLQDFNKGDLNLEGSSTTSTPIPKQPTPKGVPGKDRPWIIMLDPGHGGEDPGAIGKNRAREKDIVLQISRRLRTLIQNEKSMKMKALMTRNDDVFIPLRVRVAKARSQQADVFVSVHADAFTNRQARGSSVFVLSTKGASSSAASYLAQTQNEADEIGGVSRSGDAYLDNTIFDLVQTKTITDSMKLGNEVLKQMKKINKLHKNAVEQAGFAVLRAPDIPSILVETAFISNIEEERKLRSASFQQQVAKAIFDGIKTFLKASASTH